MTSAEVRTIYGKTNYTKESQFLLELDKSLLEGDAVYISNTKSDSDSRWSQGGGNDGYSNPEIFRPFDQLKYIKQGKKPEALGKDGSNTEFKEGDKVSHSKFGEGLVLSVKGDILNVIFDSVGVKMLAKDMAPIKKI